MARGTAPLAAPPDRRALRATKLALVVILLGMTVTGRRSTGWPVTAWAMYSRLRPVVPAEIAAEELRVVDADGSVHRLDVHDLWGTPRHPVAARAVRRAFEDRDPAARAAHRAYLVTLVTQRLPDVVVASIERWRLVWRVDPLALPPLQRDRPFSEHRLDTLTVDAATPAQAARRAAHAP